MNQSFGCFKNAYRVFQFQLTAKLLESDDFFSYSIKISGKIFKFSLKYQENSSALEKISQN